MEFIYTGIDSSSIKQKGKIEANSEKEVIEFLRQGNITPLSIRKIEESSNGLFGPQKVKNTDIILFTRQLSSMTLTGLTLIESLRILEKQVNSPAMKKIVTDLIAQISEGATFSEALSEHREAFSDTYIALIKAAEKGGLLDKVLTRLADNMEKSDDLKKRVKGAMFYPAIVISGVVIVIAVMNIFVIPQLGALYSNLNLELPTTTKIVLGFSKFTTTFAPVFILAAIGLFIGYNRFKKTKTGIEIIDKIKLKLPVFGQIFELSALDEITRTLSLMISSGASIIESLNITANVANNYWYKKAVMDSSTLVEKGISLSDALNNQKIFPPMVVQMTRVGESTGKIDESLLKISEYFERDLDVKVKTLTTAIEPILIIVLGVSVAFLILSVITPIYSLISQIQ
ncbi:MAG TPA: type II secretion system F family protein [Patescibacteria group bacterium]|nr:type II secretion system F family protein [Patescibacteria group bacterium]